MTRTDWWELIKIVVVSVGGLVAWAATHLILGGHKL